MDGDRFVEVALWVLSLILAIIFFYNGVNKIMGAPYQVAQFDAVGISGRLLLVVGALECAGGLMLILPRFALMGGSILSMLMITSAALHIYNDNMTSALRAMVIFLMLVSICYLRFKRRDSRP